MSTDEYRTEMELYGVSPGVIAIIMLIVTLLSPTGIFLESTNPWYSPVIYSFVWVYQFGAYVMSGFRMFNYDLLLTLPLCVLHLAYAYWIVRHYQGKSSGYSAAMIGVLSILLPTSLVLFFTGLFGPPVILFPIPMQFIAGLVILWRIEGPEVISPWSGLRLDLSWWKWRRGKPKDDWDPFEKERKSLENEDLVEGE
jgi:hypothetical protein